MTVRSAWHINPGQTRQDTRLAPVGAYTPIDAMTTRSGVIPGGNPFPLTGSGMVGSVGVGRAIVQGTGANQGAYPVVITAAESITVANGHASLPRIDSVFLVAYDQLYDTSGQTIAAIVYTQGTAASSPTAPTAPATGTAYLKLWDILVPAGASAGSPINWGTALTDRRTYTAGVGGITPDGATAGAYNGQYRDGGTATGLERYNGTAWEPRLYLGASGRIVMGSDTNLYRNGSNSLKTDGSLQAVGMVSAYTSSTTVVTTTSTTYADTSTVVSTTVIVPPSGKVDISGQISHYNNGTGYTYSDLLVTGSVSGSLRAPSDSASARVSSFNGTGGDNDISSCIRFLLTSANLGETLTIKWQHRVSQNTGQIDYRNISAVPLLG